MVFTEPHVGCVNWCEVRKLVRWWCFLQHLLSHRFCSILHCIHQSGALPDRVESPHHAARGCSVKVPTMQQGVVL
jgi:hypothetical protein